MKNAFSWFTVWLALVLLIFAALTALASFIAWDFVNLFGDTWGRALVALGAYFAFWACRSVAREARND